MEKNNLIIDITKKILIKCEIICEYLHRQNYYYGSKYINEIITLLGEFIDKASAMLSKEVLEELVFIFKEVSSTQEKNNYVLLGDVFKFKLMPLLEEIQKCFLMDSDIYADYFSENIDYLEDGLKLKLINNKEKSAFDGCYVEFTNIGALTLCKENGIYFHSNGDPYKEARIFADEYSDDEYTDYVIFGMGLGYHVNALLDYDSRYTVTVVDNNLDILTLAFMHNDFVDNLASKRLKIKYVEKLKDITEYISSKNEKLVMHYPSLIVLEDSPYKSALKEYFMSLSSIQAHKRELDGNFYFNKRLGDKSIDDIKGYFENRTVIYAGGGPSVQNRLNEIIELRDKEDAVLVCAGTVYIKLINANVIPDYVIITDPLPSLIKQIAGMDRTGSSMLYLSTASKEAVAAFEGTRYVVYQNDYKNAEEIAKQNGYTLFDTGGSVSTTAVDIALRFGCKKLVCVGLDLAFTNNQRHAFGIGGDITVDTNLLTVEAVDGGLINTSNNLNMYRKWIENRVSGVKDIELINMSRGAKIHGMLDK